MESNESKFPHTPEPWNICFYEDIIGILCAKNTTVIAYTEAYKENTGTYTYRQAFENAARIVFSVNACEGITNEELENLPYNALKLQRDELLAALKEARGYIQGMLGRKRSTFLDELDATIRKVEKGIEQ